MMAQRSHKPSPVLRKAIKQHTRAAYQEAILDAASAVFSRMGFVEARIADIAAEAGVSVGTLYNYFRNKDDVISSLVAYELACFHERLTGIADRPDPLERIRRILEISFRYLEERGALLTMALQAGVLQEHTAAADGCPDHHDARVHVLSLYEAALAEAIRAGRVRSELSPTRLAVTLDGMTSALIFDWVRSGQSQPLVPQADFIFDVFMKGAASR
jgi:AcrR family transcriptional regulator